MRVLNINGVIHSGSTGAIVDSINCCLKENGVECAVAYGIGKKDVDGLKFCYRYEQAINRRLSMITGYRYGFAPFATERLIRFINQYKPDLVHIHSINGNCLNIYDVLEYLKQKQIATVITNHADFFYTGNCTSALGCNGYVLGCNNCQQLKWATDCALFPNPNKSWTRMKNAFEGFENLTMVSVSEYSKECSMKSPITNKYPHKVIYNGVDTKMFVPCFNIDIRKKYGLKANRIGVLVTSGFSLDKEHLKGGYWLTELASMYSKDEFEFLVVGSDKIEVANDNILFAGRVSDRILLANIYSQSDVALSFSRSESFGMTCAESLCCGTPFVGFLCGGIESIAIKDFSRFVKNGEINEMKREIMELLHSCQNQREKISQKSSAIYSSEQMAKQYYCLYDDMVRKGDTK